jgi:hypothetical protein
LSAFMSMECQWNEKAPRQEARRPSNLQEQIKGQVVWIEEVGFLSIRQMLELQEFALHHNCRLVLTAPARMANPNPSRSASLSLLKVAKVEYLIPT